MTGTSATVVIATLNRPALLERCLDALADQTVAPEAIVIVGSPGDLASQKIVHAMRQRLPSIEWLTEDRGGHVPPIHQATVRASTKFVAWLDDDAYPISPDWLARLIEPFQAGDVACVGGPVMEANPRRIPRDAGAIRWYGRRMGNVGGLQVSDLCAVSSVPEGNCCWLTSVVKSLDFTADLQLHYPVHYGLDLALQAKRSGWRTMFTPHASVMHTPDPRRTSGDRQTRMQLAYAYGHNMTFIALRHFPVWQRVIYLCWALLIGDGSMMGLTRALLSAPRKPSAVSAWIAATQGHIAAIRRVVQLSRTSSP